MTDDRVRLSIADGIATVTLARPEKLNALDQAMLAALEARIAAIEADEAVRVAILAAEGDRAFCAGGDITAWSHLDPMAMGSSWVREGHRVLDRLARLRVPVVAVIAGRALGGGLELAATADLRIAERHVVFGMPETGLGMVPGWSGTQRLVRRFGAQVIRKMCFAGIMFTADEALAAGFVDEVCSTGGGLDRALAMAAQMAGRAPVAMQVAKLMINGAEGEEQAAAIEAIGGALVSYTEDLKEGVASFRERRTPRFRGR